jgi:hypothetical protein
MTPPFHWTDWSTAGQGNTFVGDAAIAEPALLGATGFFHKVSEGTGYKDPAFRRRRPAAQQYRSSGGYHWVSPGKDLNRQLGNFGEQIGDLAVGEGIQLDCEQTGLDTAFVETAWNLWAATYGQDRVCTYMGRFFTGGNGRKTAIIDELPEHILWWLAWYSTASYSQIASRLPREPFVWQWGGGKEGVFIPLVGRVDSNQVINAAAAERFCGLSAPAPPPDPGPPPLPPPTLIPWANVPEEDDMASREGPFFIQATGADGHLPGRIYKTDGRGMTLRQIETPARLDHARWLLKTAGYDPAAVDAAPTPADDVEAYGHVVNP